jgi:poly(hydroxyalkanoate) granule-associated protein
MATRKTTQGPFDNEAAKAVSDSAQKIWLAGLGAFERARAEGPRMFDTLVEQGRGLAGRAQGAAGEALRTVRDSAVEANARLDKLEQSVQERLARSAERVGILTRGEVDDLATQVRELTASVREMMAANAARGTREARTAPRRAKAAAGTTKRKATAARKAVGNTARKAVGKTTRKARRGASTGRR